MRPSRLTMNSSVQLMTDIGRFRLLTFVDEVSREETLVLVRGEVFGKASVPCLVLPEFTMNPTVSPGERLAWADDCFERMHAGGFGILVYLPAAAANGNVLALVASLVRTLGVRSFELRDSSKLPQPTRSTLRRPGAVRRKASRARPACSLAPPSGDLPPHLPCA